MSTAVVEPAATDSGAAAPKPLTTGKQSAGVLIALWLFVTLPFVALIASVPVMWGWGLNWIDVVLFVAFYAVGAFGIGVGFHRYLTHGSFKAKRPLRIALALAAHRPRGGRQHRDRRRGDPVGGRPPPAPPVQRHGGRPAFTVAVR